MNTSNYFQKFEKMFKNLDFVMFFFYLIRKIFEAIQIDPKKKSALLSKQHHFKSNFNLFHNSFRMVVSKPLLQILRDFMLFSVASSSL